MANTMTQAQVEALLRPFGFTGSATGGAAQAFINANPAAAAAMASASAPPPPPPPPPLSKMLLPDKGASSLYVAPSTPTAAPAQRATTTPMPSTPLPPPPVAPPAQTVQPATTENWNSDIATELAQFFGILQPGEVAKGGLLDQRLKTVDPNLAGQFNQIALALQQGKSSAEQIAGMLTDHYVKQQEADPNYGKLTEAPYKDFKPFSLSDMMADPGHQFQIDEGNKAIDRAQAARGGFFSGQALKEAAKYNQGMAATGYDAARNRYNQDFEIAYNQKARDSDTLYSRLAGVAQTGYGATNTAVGANQNNANAMGNIYGQTGQVQANNAINQGNNQAATLSQILGSSFGNSQYANTPWMKPGNVRPGGGYY